MASRAGQRKPTLRVSKGEGVVDYIYLTDGKGIARTNDEELAQAVERLGFRRCDRREWTAIGRRLRRQRENRKNVRDAARPRDAEAQP